MRVSRIVTVLFVIIMACVAVDPVGAQGEMPDAGVDAAMPVPTYPVGVFITQKLPIYKFTLDPSALKYEVQVFTKDTHMLVESIKGFNCTSYCLLKSTIPLKTFVRGKQKGCYTWRVRPKYASGWSSTWSAEVEFIVLSTGFTSYFDTLDSKWSTVRGTWMVNSLGYYKTLGELDHVSSAIEKHWLAGQGMVYEVRLKRKGEGGSPNILYFLGEPEYPDPYGEWNLGYRFEFDYGGWRLSRYDEVGGAGIANDHFIYPYSGWVKLTIWRWGSEISLWVNEDYIGTFTDSTYNTGYVGIGMVEVDPGDSPLLVDWAKVYYSANPPYAKY